MGLAFCDIANAHDCSDCTRSHFTPAEMFSLILPDLIRVVALSLSFEEGCALFGLSGMLLFVAAVVGVKCQNASYLESLSAADQTVAEWQNAPLREYKATLSSVTLNDFDECPAYFYTPNPTPHFSYSFSSHGPRLRMNTLRI